MYENKVVNFPIKVPENEHCFGSKSLAICEFFSNEAGNPYCYLRLGELEYDETRAVKKPDDCKQLKESK